MIVLIQLPSLFSICYCSSVLKMEEEAYLNIKEEKLMKTWNLVMIFALVSLLAVTIITGCEDDDESDVTGFEGGDGSDGASGGDDDEVTCDGYETKWDQTCEDFATFAVSCNYEDSEDNCKASSSFCHDLYVCYFDCYDLFEECEDFDECMVSCEGLA